MWRPLRPSVKRQLRRLQSGETSCIVVATNWEYDEVDRRMRRFQARLELTKTTEVEHDSLAEVIPFRSLSVSGDYSYQRELKVVGSDVEPDERPSIQSKLVRPPAGIRIPNALDSLPKANPKEGAPEDEAEVDLSRLAELLDFVVWLVRENGVVEISELTQYICYQFEIGTYSDREIESVLKTILFETKERGSN